MANRGHVFVSYRRDSGAELARNVREALLRRGFSVFMDVEDLRGGPFNAALLREIEAATDVIVILTPGSLDRSLETPDDWLRLEVAHAFRQSKNVVPILTGRFSWPDRPLPDDLKSLPLQSGLTVSHEYFDASMNRLADRLLVGRPRGRLQTMPRLALVAGLCVLGAIVTVPWWYGRLHPILTALLTSGSRTSPSQPVVSAPSATPVDQATSPDPNARNNSAETPPTARKKEVCEPPRDTPPSPGPVWPVPEATWHIQSPPDATRYVVLDSDKGDYIGGGKRYVYTITFAAGKISTLDLRFEQHCDERNTALRGSIHWAS